MKYELLKEVSNKFAACETFSDICSVLDRLNTSRDVYEVDSVEGGKETEIVKAYTVVELKQGDVIKAYGYETLEGWEDGEYTISSFAYDESLGWEWL